MKRNWLIVKILLVSVIALLLGWSITLTLGTEPIQANTELPPLVAPVPTNMTINTVPTPTLPSRLKLFAPAFQIKAVSYPVTMTVDTTGLVDDTSRLHLVYQAKPQDKWQLVYADHNAHIIQSVALPGTGMYAWVWLTPAAVPPVPLRALVVDDVAPEFVTYTHSTSQYWHIATTGGDYYGGHTHWTRNTQTVTENWATWQPATPLTGSHAVWVYVPNDYADTEYARYTVSHAGISTTIEVDQNAIYPDAAWVRLGAFNFISTTASYVQLTDTTGEPYDSHWIAFDAVAFVPQASQIYLPLVLRNWPPPPPIKSKLGIHLGNHENDTWTNEMLLSIDGDNGGIWPKVIVVQSKQLWHIDRFPSGQGSSEEPDCSIAGARPIETRSNVHEYLGRAMEDGVKVIIRITPAPGNFMESILSGWPDPTLVPTRTILTLPRRTPEDRGYCYPNYELFRAIDDIAEEMDAIHDVMANWPEDGYYFEPANEPNLEWYGPLTKPAISTNVAWAMMDAYFSALMTYIQTEYPELQVLTPPMSQAQYAEGIEWMHPEDPCKAQLLSDGSTGYETMQDTHNFQANWYNGYSWHNYYTQGRETYRACADGGFHISYHFPDNMNRAMLLDGHPGFVTETDLCSWSDGNGGWEGQCFNSNPLQSKHTVSETTSTSLRYFVGAEEPATAVALWLLSNDEANRGEYDWHEAYDIQNSQPYDWFRLLWSTSE